MKYIKRLLSKGLQFISLAFLSGWWVWLLGGSIYYYMAEHVTLWQSLTSGAGMSLVASVSGSFSSFLADLMAS